MVPIRKGQRLFKLIWFDTEHNTDTKKQYSQNLKSPVQKKTYLQLHYFLKVLSA